MAVSERTTIRQNERRMKFLSPKCTLAFVALAVVGTAHADLEYTVRPMPASKTFSMKMVITNAKQLETIRIPGWCPGFYFMLDYEKRLSDFKAVDPEGNPLATKKLDSRGYQVQNPKSTPITVSYRILGNDTGLGFFRSHLRNNIGFINGPSAFMFAADHMLDTCRVNFNLPADWDIATAMDTDGKGTYTANGYDEMVDHPIQLGKFIRKKFTVENIPFEAIWVGDPAPRCNIDEETERLRRGSLPALKMMGGASFKKYIYFVHLEVGDFAGGLEHRASNVIAVANTESVHLDSLATHEYFHAWNVKQIRPFILGPFDYTTQQRSPNIWFSEGVTDYYAQIHAYQAGFMSRSQLLETLTNNIEELQVSKTRLKLTLEEVCKQTWENGGFGVGDLSYYTKGLVIGLIADSYLRGESKGKTSLDDLMRSFYAKYQLPKPGFQDNDIKDAFISMGGTKMGPLYDTLVRTTNEVPYDLLTKMGLRLLIPGQTYTEPLYILSESGAVTNATASNLEGGIKDGDIVLNAKVVAENVIEVKVQRASGNATVRLQARTFRAGDYRLQANPFATPEEKQRLEEWLKLP